MLFSPPRATEKSEQQYWYYAEGLETSDSTKLGTDLYLERNTLGSQRFGIFSVTSFPFHFVLSENNRKVISTGLQRKMVNARIL